MPQIEQPVSDTVEIDLREAFRKLNKHRQTLLSAIVIAIAAALIYSATATPIFKASGRILIETKRPKITKVDNQILSDNAENYDLFNSFFNSQIEILKSPAVAETVFKDLGGYEPWARRGKPADKLKPFTDQQRVESLLKKVKITPVRMTQVIAISAQDPDPKLAARIVNSWTHAYVQFSSSDQFVQRKKELDDDLNQQLKYLKDKHPVILALRSEIAAIDQKISQTSENISTDINNVKVLERAQPPIKPIRPRKALNVALALVLGVFLGGVLVFIFESLDQTIKSPTDIEHFLKMVSLVVLPRYQLEKDHPDLTPEFLSLKARHSTVAEAFRSLRTSIIFSSPDLSKKTFLVTSASPSEGKSTVAVNLATVFAHAEERVLLVDTDMRNPRLHSVFGMERSNGVTDLIANDKNSAESFVRKTEIPGVDLLTCGELPPDPSEILGSKKMTALITKLTSMYDRVIFDTPPVLAATDAVVLSTQVDATLVVIKAGDVHRQAVIRTVDALRAVHAKLLGGVLNMADPSELGGYYYYYIYGEHAKKNARGKKTKGLVKKGAVAGRPA